MSTVQLMEIAKIMIRKQNSMAPFLMFTNCSCNLKLTPEWTQTSVYNKDAQDTE